MARMWDGSQAPPWSRVMGRRDLPGYRVLLSLSCGHSAARMRRTHRVYRRVQCEDCLKAIPVLPAVPPAPRLEIKVVIRPDIHRRFLTIAQRVEDQLEAQASALRRGIAERPVEDDFGLNEYAVHLPSLSGGRLPPHHVERVEA